MDYPQEHVKPYDDNGHKTEQVEQMFDHIAPAYDRLNHTLSLGIDRKWRRRAIEWLKHFQPQQVMDVATGTGDFAILSYRMLKPQTLIGIDISEKMMQIGYEKVKKARLEKHIYFQRENCESLSFPESTFDAITVAFGIRNFEHLDRGLQEMYRVLRKGGHLVILELSTPNHFPMKQLYRIYSKLIPFIGRLISHDNNAYTYLPESIRAFPQSEIMQESIRRAGFSEVNFRQLTFGICTLYMATK